MFPALRERRGGAAARTLTRGSKEHTQKGKEAVSWEAEQTKRTIGESRFGGVTQETFTHHMSRARVLCLRSVYGWQKTEAKKKKTRTPTADV